MLGFAEQDETKHDDCLHHSTTVTARLPNLTPHVPTGQIWIGEEDFCSDTRYEEKLQEKEEQHVALETALRLSQL